MTLKNRIKEIEEVFEEEKRKLKDRIKDLEHDGLQTRAEIEFKEDTLNNLQGRFEHVQLDLEKVKLTPELGQGGLQKPGGRTEANASTKL